MKHDQAALYAAIAIVVITAIFTIRGCDLFVDCDQLVTARHDNVAAKKTDALVIPDRCRAVYTIKYGGVMPGSYRVVPDHAAGSENSAVKTP